MKRKLVFRDVAAVTGQESTLVGPLRPMHDKKDEPVHAPLIGFTVTATLTSKARFALEVGDYEALQ